MAAPTKSFIKDNVIVRYITSLFEEVEQFVTATTKKIFKYVSMLVDYVDKYTDTALGTVQKVISDPKVAIGIVFGVAILLDLIFKGRIGVINLIVTTFTTIVGVLVSAGPLVAVLVVTVLIVLFTRK